jgi:hypothetical protein
VSATVWPTVRLAVAGLTVTDATGTVLTVIVAVPLCPSLVAVRVAEPAATPVTTPLPLTVATAALLLVQVITRPLSGLPLASFGVAVSATVCPTVTLAVAGLTVTDATGAAGTLTTVTLAVPARPSLVAVRVAAPADMPVATPLALTAVTVGLLDAQVTARPVRTVPFASVRTLLSCRMLPTVRLSDGGATATDATGAGGFGPMTTESGFSHAASAAVESTSNRIRARRWDNLNVKGMTPPANKKGRQLRLSVDALAARRT